MNKIFLNKVYRIVKRKLASYIGGFYNLENTLDIMCKRPFELHLELTNICNANCVFCPYQYQQRQKAFMSDAVFFKSVKDFCDIGGGFVSLTPIVGDALVDPKFLDRVKYLRSLTLIDRINLVTNGILLDKHGVDKIIDSGITSIFISTAGFQKEMYERIYRNNFYERMKKNVAELIKVNAKKGNPVFITVGLRSDRSLDEVLQDPDFSEILLYKPQIDFAWSFTSAGGRIKKENLPKNMKLRVVDKKSTPCVQLFNGPIILPEGDVLACSCVAAIDAIEDLKIGNIFDKSLIEIWNDSKIREIRSFFGTDKLNPTCFNCDMYRDTELYKTNEGRRRANLNKLRLEGKVVFRQEKPKEPFSGG